LREHPRARERPRDQSRGRRSQLCEVTALRVPGTILVEQVHITLVGTPQACTTHLTQHHRRAQHTQRHTEREGDFFSCCGRAREGTALITAPVRRARYWRAHFMTSCFSHLSILRSPLNYLRAQQMIYERLSQCRLSDSCRCRYAFDFDSMLTWSAVLAILPPSKLEAFQRAIGTNALKVENGVWD